jgi:hypothetical protein
MNWKETASKDSNRKIYDEEIRHFIPDAIFDFHTHVFNAEAIPGHLPGVELPGFHIKSYTIPELKKDCEEIYPGKRCRAVGFGFPDNEYNSNINNRYVAEKADRKTIFPFRLIRPDEDPAAVEEELRSMRFFGIKPYWNYVTGKKADDVEINDMLPPGIMEVVDRLGVIVMLHIPRSLRLADPVNQMQIVQLARTYRNTRIILAHIGRAYYLKNVVGHLDNIIPLQNVYCDTSMLNNWEVLEYLFAHFDSKRILYGTDIPFALCGGKSVEINDQYTYITSKPWHLSISDDHGKLVFTSFIYEQIRAVRKACDRLGLSRTFVQDFFFQNGYDLIHSVSAGKGEER